MVLLQLGILWVFPLLGVLGPTFLEEWARFFTDSIFFLAPVASNAVWRSMRFPGMGHSLEVTWYISP